MTTASAPRSSGAFQLPAAGLPIQLTTFVGREMEIAAVSDLLQSARLLTLTGVGPLLLGLAGLFDPFFDFRHFKKRKDDSHESHSD